MTTIDTNLVNTQQSQRSTSATSADTSSVRTANQSAAQSTGDDSIDILRLTSIVRNRAAMALMQADQQSDMQKTTALQSSQSTVQEIRQIFFKLRDLSTQASTADSSATLQNIQSQVQQLNQQLTSLMQTVSDSSNALDTNVQTILENAVNATLGKSNATTTSLASSLSGLLGAGSLSATQTTDFLNQTIASLDSQNQSYTDQLLAIQTKPIEGLSALAASLDSATAAKLATATGSLLTGHSSEASDIASQLANSVLAGVSF